MDLESKIDLENNILIYKGVNVLLVRDENNILWCKAKKFLLQLKYKDCKDVLRQHVNNENKKYFLHFSDTIRKQYKMHPYTMFIDKNAMDTIIIKSRLLEVLEFSKLWEINKLSKYICKEHNILINVIKYLDKIKVNYIPQYKVKKYKIDCYLPDYRIAIEIDEDNHKSRNKEYEKERQIEIEKNLNCKFIRVNPDDKQFDIFSFIGDIQNEINEFKLLK